MEFNTFETTATKQQQGQFNFGKNGYDLNNNNVLSSFNHQFNPHLHHHHHYQQNSPEFFVANPDQSKIPNGLLTPPSSQSPTLISNNSTNSIIDFNDYGSQSSSSQNGTSVSSFGWLDGTIMIKSNGLDNGNGNGSMKNRNSSTIERSMDERIQTRRQKNRESAARSRQKIKNMLIEYQKRVKTMLEQKEALINERCLILKELDYLETAVLNTKMKSISEELQFDPLTIIPTPPDSDLSSTTSLDSFLDKIPDLDLDEIQQELSAIFK